MKINRITLAVFMALPVLLFGTSASADEYWDMFRFRSPGETRVAAPDHGFSAGGIVALPLLDMADQVGVGCGASLAYVRRTHGFYIGTELGFIYFTGREISMFSGSAKSTEYFLMVPLFVNLGYSWDLPGSLYLDPVLSFGASFDVLSFNPTGTSYLGNTAEYEDRYEVHPAVRAGITLGIPVTEHTRVTITPAYVVLMEFFDGGFTKFRTSHAFTTGVAVLWRF
ncbi:MAG: hypothetical protein JXA20_17425 [Spirochaetes bacterium]|nr:hypothetical protein [Spirochaetota bacterium]